LALRYGSDMVTVTPRSSTAFANMVDIT
jgi:hypothetical protein